MNIRAFLDQISSFCIAIRFGDCQNPRRRHGGLLAIFPPFFGHSVDRDGLSLTSVAHD
jgi:hypothetical protein